MERRMIIAIAILIIVVLLIVFWPRSSGQANRQVQVNVPPNSSSVSSNAISTTPATVEFYAVNIQYVYTGPDEVNGIGCGLYTHTIYEEEKEVLNGSQDFYMDFYPSTNYCPVTVRNVTSDTPGFVVLNTEPQVPINLPGESIIEMQVNFRAPDVNYYGPLTITIGYS